VTGKAEFLSRLRDAVELGSHRARRPIASATVLPPVVPRHGSAGSDVVEGWAEALRRLGGHVHHSPATGVAAAVNGAIDGRAPVLFDRSSADAADLVPLAQRLTWPDCGLDVAATAACGVVRATAAVAATGSIVVDSSRAGRLVSLLPPVAVFVVAASSVVALTGDVLRRREELWPAGPPTNVVFVTGPSRSGDIEMILAVGVHGPGEVHAVLVDDA
jgi:L-lactate utilization protein LutC